jgi:DnaJ-class molecular chaperone
MDKMTNDQNANVCEHCGGDGYYGLTQSALGVTEITCRHCGGTGRASDEPERREGRLTSSPTHWGDSDIST